MLNFYSKTEESFVFMRNFKAAQCPSIKTHAFLSIDIYSWQTCIVFNIFSPKETGCPFSFKTLKIFVFVINVATLRLVPVQRCGENVVAVPQRAQPRLPVLVQPAAPRRALPPARAAHRLRAQGSRLFQISCSFKVSYSMK